MKQTQLINHDTLWGGESMMLPSTPHWCSTCKGTGRRHMWDNRGFDIDDMLSEDDDGEQRERYFSGIDDEACNQCENGITIRIDYENLNPEQKAFYDEDMEARDEKAREDDMRARGIQF